MGASGLGEETACVRQSRTPQALSTRCQGHSGKRLRFVMSTLTPPRGSVRTTEPQLQQ